MVSRWRFQRADLFRQDNYGRDAQSKCGAGSQWRIVRINFNDGRAALQGFEWEPGGGMHEGRGANGEKQIARTAHGERALDGVGREHFAEPDNVGSQSSAAAWTPRRHIAAFLPFVDDLVLFKNILCD